MILHHHMTVLVTLTDCVQRTSSFLHDTSTRGVQQCRQVTYTTHFNIVVLKVLPSMQITWNFFIIIYIHVPYVASRVRIGPLQSLCLSPMTTGQERQLHVIKLQFQMCLRQNMTCIVLVCNKSYQNKPTHVLPRQKKILLSSVRHILQPMLIWT